MPATLNIVQLQTFVSVAGSLSFTHSAKRLGISQPALTQRIQSLERQRGHALIDRDAKPLRLTPDGELLLLRAREILAAHDESLVRLGTPTREAVVVGITHHLAADLLPPLRERLREHWPDLAFRFELNGSTDLARATAAGSVDLSVVINHNELLPGAEVSRIDLEWVAPAGWSADLAESGIPLISITGECAIRDRASLLLLDQGLPFTRVGGVVSAQEALTAVRGGAGIALVPRLRARTAGVVINPSALPAAGIMRVNLVCGPGLDESLARTARECTMGVLDRLTTSPA